KAAAAATSRPVEAPLAPYRAPWGLVLGFSGGVDLSQPFNTYGTSPSVELELGWTPPALEQRLTLMLMGEWLIPTRETEINDPRFDAPVKEETRLHTLRLTAGALYRYHLTHSATWGQTAFTVGGGARAWLYEIEQEAKAGDAAFGLRRETGTAWGGVAFGGLEWFRGPGAVVLEGALGWAPSGDMGTLNFSFGWRHFF
ncbi:hypothetical protein KKB55_16500, partial [Myxococcota bacterium]|nr:hypothetical protein [Myxococcota bacterium]